MMLYARLSDRRMHVPRGARDHACAVLVRFLYLRPLFSLFFYASFASAFPCSLFFLFLRSVSVFLSCPSLFFFLSRSLWLLLSPTLFWRPLFFARALALSFSRSFHHTRARFWNGGKIEIRRPGPARPRRHIGVESPSTRAWKCCEEAPNHMPSWGDDGDGDTRRRRRRPPRPRR